MNDTECGKKKVKIAPHNYSKENYLATFTPQKQLTSEQIFWSHDLIKIQAKALSAKAKSANPNRALTVYHPNILAKLVPKVLPTRSQAENEKVKRHYKELYDSIKITCAKTIEKTNSLLIEVANLKAQIKENHKSNCVTMPAVKSKVLAPGMYVINVEPILPRNKNNREVHLDYLKHLKTMNKTNEPVIPSIGVKGATATSGSKPRSNTKKDRALPAKSCSKHMTKDHSQLMNFVKMFIETVRFGNDHFGTIMGYGDYVIGDNVISRASKNKSWFWHCWLNHLNFDTFNDLARKDLVRGLPRLKFKKDHLCSACQLRKSQKYSYKPKSENTNLEVLHTLHMDLCRPMRVQAINGKKYILVIVDDYSRFTWVKFLRLKDETPEFVINFLKQIPVSLNKTIRFIGTDNGTELNDIVERRNRTLVEAAQTMLIFSKALMFLWVEVFATAPGSHAPAVPVLVTSTGTPSSTTIDQDAPSLSHSPSSSTIPSLNLHQGVAAGTNIIEYNPFAPVDNDPFVNVFAPEPSSEASSSEDEEVYVCQPEGLVDPNHPTHVYLLKKALYSIKQAPRAWYDTLSWFLLDNKFSKGAIDPTLFTRKTGKHILLIQIYVDDIIFASTDPKAYTAMALTAYADADHAGCQDTRRSTSGSAQFLRDKLVSWSSKKQKSTAISSIEVKKGVVELYFVTTDYQLTDIFTKALPRERFEFILPRLGMMSMTLETLRRLQDEDGE
nr:hypothetical protein [Tanacetum cinerariifolium]